MIAPALIFVVGWLFVLAFAIGGTTVAMRGVTRAGAADVGPLIATRRPTHHYEFPAVEAVQ